MAILKWVVSLALLSAALIGVGCFCLAKTCGFAMYKIRSELCFSPRWEVTPLPAEEMSEIKSVLSQPFRFLGNGAQAYVFLSLDGNYVIKFFKHHSLKPSPLLEAFPLPFHLQRLRATKMLEKRDVLARTFTSYKIAYEELKEETGIVFLHLNKSSSLDQKLTLIDNIGIAHELDLDRMEFFVQKRAALFYPSLEQAIAEEQIESGKKLLSELVELLAVRHRKGIFDKNPDLMTNFGCLRDKVIQIDVGRFSKDPMRKDPKVYPLEIAKITGILNAWLKKRCPLLSDHLEGEIAKLENHA